MMMAPENPHYVSEAKREWYQARRKARQLRLMKNLDVQDEATDLLNFDAVSHRLNLHHPVYRGLQNVPLDRIVGSVGRYQDFTRAFLPVDDGIRHRWEKIATIYLDPTSGGVPPIEVYKVGSAYFVKDGNHRVSVARQFDMADIEAYVWEHPEPVAGLPADLDIDDMVLEVERREFLATTRLDELRPGHTVRLTAPGGYPALQQQIVDYQRSLSQIDGHAVSYEQAVVDWYDMVYETTVQVIEEAGILDLFPDRTMADFYVWVKAHQGQLGEHYRRTVPVSDAARDFRNRTRKARTSRTWQAVVRWLVQRLVP